MLQRSGPVRPDTRPEPWDHAEMAALLAPPREVTTAMERPPPREQPREQGRDQARQPTQVAPRPRPTPPVAPPAAKQKRPRRRRRGPLLLVLALLVAAAVGGGAWWFGYARYTTTPGVIGLTQADAQTRLEGAGLDVTVGEPAYSSTVVKGHVISTDPGAGDRVLDGGDVTVVVSLGKEIYDLPKLTDITEDEAQDRIDAVKMVFGKSSKQWSETVAKGLVISSDPASGTTLRPGTIVDLVVSKGRRPIPVGDWVGKDADDAQSALEERGLDVQVSQQYSDSVDEGLVISQDPGEGTLYKGDPVQLLVSLGPELVEVPNVVAFGVDDATSTLESAGFDVDVQESAGYLGLGFVYSMDPGADTEVPKGSTITLYLV